MKKNIAILNEFLTRGELRLRRRNDVFLILRIDEEGKAGVIRNPHTGRGSVLHITLTEKEIAKLASLCFPPKEKSNG